MLVTFERLVAIRFTIHYPFLIAEKKVKIYVAIFWIIAFCSWALKYTTTYVVPIIVGLLVPSCIIFIVTSYVICTARHFVTRNESRLNK